MSLLTLSEIVFETYSVKEFHVACKSSRNDCNFYFEIGSNFNQKLLEFIVIINRCFDCLHSVTI